MSAFESISKRLRSRLQPTFTRSVYVCVFALSAAALVSVARAQNPTDPAVAEAHRLMDASQPDAAYALLDPMEEAHAGDPDFDYLFGIAALDSGHMTRAIFALERVLAAQPDNALARAEIGRAYLAAGETNTAQDELRQVRASPIPQAAIPAVDWLLNAIDQLHAGQTTQIRGYVDAGLGRDSNVNSATGNNQIAVPALGGLIFTLDPNSTRASDNFSLLGGGVDVRVPIAPDLAFAGNLAASQVTDEHLNQFDFGTIDGSAGLAKTVGSEAFSAAVQGGSAWVGSSRYRDVYGLTGQWQHNFDPQTQTTIFLQTSRLSYPGDEIRNVNRWVIGAGYGHGFSSGQVIYLSAYVGTEDELASNAPQIGDNLYGLRAGLQMPVRDKAQFFANASYEERHYGGQEPLFNATRSDHWTTLAMGVNYSFASQWRFTPQLSYTSNNSNIPIYAFKRTAVSATVRREF